MLNADNLRMMGRVIQTVTETRVMYKDDDAIGFDEAGVQAITAVVGNLLNPEEEHADPPVAELMLTVTIELLHELPKPSSGEDLISRLAQRIGVQRGT